MVRKEHGDTSDSIFVQAVELLQEPDPEQKASGTRRVAELWRQQRLSATVKGCVQPPDRPRRDDAKVRQSGVAEPGWS